MNLTRLLAMLGAAILASPDTEAATYPLPPEGDSVIGQIRYVLPEYDDTFVDLAWENNVGYRELQLANPGIDPWIPGADARVAIPSSHILPDTPREGIVLNVPEMRLYYYPKAAKGEPAKVITYPISIGRQDWRTPLGLTRLIRKDRNPAWYPPESIRAEHEARGDPLEEVVPPGPDNPLGTRALRLGIPGYLLHGTNKPAGIGMQVTHGCIRLFPEDIENLYEQVAVGTPVRIVDQPYKTGWHNGELYLEVHPPLDREEGGAKDLTPIVRHLEETAELEGIKLDWALARNLASNPNGLPVAVSLSNTAGGGASPNGLSTVQTATRDDEPTEDTVSPEIF
ncbi:MAG: L,D-transpeptidase family protein [Gammaproteobacteria bacterium]|jgi:L,D-transpeptidase ErfK/SrfK|nr:L,D-transpeptidase family protein [Gammaproteobacteria bacterium]